MPSILYDEQRSSVLLSTSFISFFLLVLFTFDNHPLIFKSASIALIAFILFTHHLLLDYTSLLVPYFFGLALYINLQHCTFYYSFIIFNLHISFDHVKVIIAEFIIATTYFNPFNILYQLINFYHIIILTSLIIQYSILTFVIYLLKKFIRYSFFLKIF